MNLSPMVRAYLECALWSSSDDEGDSLDDYCTLEDCAPELLAQATEDCDAFADMNVADLDAYINRGSTYADFGHDFWLTRNGHGAGFWDRGLGDLGDRLTAAAKVYGSVDLYVDDMGRVHG